MFDYNKEEIKTCSFIFDPVWFLTGMARYFIGTLAMAALNFPLLVFLLWYLVEIVFIWMPIIFTRTALGKEN